MAYVNTPKNEQEMVELETEPSNYSSLTQRREDETIYNELQPNVVPNITDQPPKKCMSNLKLKLAWISLGSWIVVVLAVSISVITAVILKQDIDSLRNEIVSLKLNKSKDLVSNKTVMDNVNDTWNQWLSWGSCSVTCGVGLERRDRSCSNQEGNHCVGDARDDRVCVLKPCAEPLVYFTVNTPTQALVSERPIFMRVKANVGGAYNQTTGLFVCPISGLYQFYFSFVHKTNQNIWCFLYHNDSALTMAYAGANSDIHRKQTSASVFVELKQGDTFYAGGGCVNWKYVNAAMSGLFTGSLIHTT